MLMLLLSTVISTCYNDLTVEGYYPDEFEPYTMIAYCADYEILKPRAQLSLFSVPSESNTIGFLFA